MGVTRGDPRLLAAYTDATTARVARSRGVATDYGAAVRRLLAAPSDLPVAVADRSAAVLADLDDLDRLDQQPARFAAALRLADQLARFPWVGGRPLATSPPIDPAAAQALAADLADDLRGSLRDGWFDPALLARLEQAVAVPELAVALIDELGVETLLSFPIGLDHRYRSMTMGTMWDPDRPPHAFREDGERVIDALAQALALASQHGLPARFADDLVDSATTTHGHAVGLSLLLGRGGTFDARFARRVAEGLYDAERTSGRSPYWRPLAEDAQGVVPSFFGSDHWFDPLTSASVALAAHPLTAQRFLLGDDPAGDGDRLDYLTGHRTWYADDGTGYGQLIEAATTVHRDALPGTSSPGYRSALIASRFLDALPYQEGGGWNPFRDTTPGYRLYPGLVPTVGTILAVYVHDVQTALHLADSSRTHSGSVWTVPSDDLPLDAFAYGISLDNDRLPLLLEAVARDDVAFSRIVAAHHLLAQQQLDHVAGQLGSTDPDRLREDLRSLLQRNGALSGHVLHAANLAAISDASSADARVATLAGLVDTGVGAVTPGGPLTRAAVGQVTGPLTDQLGSSSYEEAARIEATTAVRLQQVHLADLTHDALLRHGWYDADGPMGGFAPSDEVRFIADDGGLLPRGSLDVTGAQQLDRWRTGAGTADLLNDITTSMDSAIGRYR